MVALSGILKKRRVLSYWLELLLKVKASKNNWVKLDRQDVFKGPCMQDFEKEKSSAIGVGGFPQWYSRRRIQKLIG